MGLDSYLRKKHYVRCWKSDENSVQDADSVDVMVCVKYPDGTKENHDYVAMKPESGATIELPVAYWRKANAIHRWFVQNCADGEDDCRAMFVPYKKLVELRDLCEKVLADHSKAAELLPTQDGFFFGSTEYDEWYFNDVKHTLEVLKDIDENGTYEYEASW